MYLAKYIIVALIFAGALVTVIRAKSASDPNTNGGTVIRAVLTLLLLALTGVIWYYSNEDFIKNENIEKWVRVISGIAFVSTLPGIWLDKKKEE